MNKRSFALIMATAALVLCLLSPFAGAVTISYTADSGGESVSISENYDVDNSVTVKESTDISFGNLQVDQERTVEGTGEADLKQTISGKSVAGTGYVAENDILSNGTVDAKTYTSATGTTLGVAQTVSVTGDAELLLEGEEGGNLAGQYAIVENGRLNSKQTLDIGNSVRASLDASIWGDFGAARSVAEDADGNLAWTEVAMKKGELSTVQGAEADGSATADQVSDVDAKRGVAVSGAEDADGNLAWTEVAMKKGELSTVQGAEADGSATADQVSDVDAKWGVAASGAEDAEGNWALTSVEMKKGELSTVQGAEADGSATADQVSDVDAKWGVATSVAIDADSNWALTSVEMEKGELSTVQGAEADGCATADQVSNVDAKWGYAGSVAVDADGNNWAETVVVMEKGELSAVQGAEADGSATADQVSDVDAKWGYAGSVAVDADGNNWAETVVVMEKGELSTVQGAEADGSATADQVSDVDAKWGYAGSVAEDADGNNWAATVVVMEKGELSTIQGAEADGSAAAVQDSYIEGNFAWAACEAVNADGRVYVDNYVVGNAVLDFEGEALATDDGVFAAQLSYAEGDFINPRTIAENQYGYTFIENVVIDGTLYSASGAIANEDVAFCSQDMSATGSYIYFFMEANNTHQGFQHTFSDEFWNAWVNAEAAEEVNEPGLWMVLAWESGPLGP